MSKKTRERKLQVVKPTAPRAEHAVGSVVEVGADKLVQVQGHLGRLSDLQRQLGALLEDYEAKRSQLVQLLGKERSAYAETVHQVGVDLGLDLSPTSHQAWTFNPDQARFTRTA